MIGVAHMPLLSHFAASAASSPPEKSGCRMYTHFMQHLQSVTKGILKRVEEITGKSIQFMRDDNLAVLSTLFAPIEY
jgi:hypothetical protein